MTGVCVRCLITEYGPGRSSNRRNYVVAWINSRRNWVVVGPVRTSKYGQKPNDNLQQQQQQQFGVCSLKLGWEHSVQRIPLTTAEQCSPIPLRWCSNRPLNLPWPRSINVRNLVALYQTVWRFENNFTHMGLFGRAAVEALKAFHPPMAKIDIALSNGIGVGGLKILGSRDPDALNWCCDRLLAIQSINIGLIPACVPTNAQPSGPRCPSALPSLTWIGATSRRCGAKAFGTWALPNLIAVIWTMWYLSHESSHMQHGSEKSCDAKSKFCKFKMEASCHNSRFWLYLSVICSD